MLRDAARKVAARRAKVSSGKTARDERARPTAEAQVVRVAARQDTGFHMVGESGWRRAQEKPTAVEGCRLSHATGQGDPTVEDLEQVNLRGARVMAQKVVPREVCGGDSERQMECIHPAEKSTDHTWNRLQRGSKRTAGEGRSIQPAEGNEYKYESADLRPRRKDFSAG